jgi:chemotaxis protein histidine kinase CheA
MLESRYQITDDNVAIFQDFLREAPQLFEVMEASLLHMAQNKLSWEPLDAVLRSLHTLKGIFGFMKMPSMIGLCQRAESALEPYKSDSISFSKELLYWMLRVLDLIRSQVIEISIGLPGSSFVIKDVSIIEAAPHFIAEDSMVASAPASGLEAKNSKPRMIAIQAENMDRLLEMIAEVAHCQSRISDRLLDQTIPQALAAEFTHLGALCEKLSGGVRSVLDLETDAPLDKQS